MSEAAVPPWLTDLSARAEAIAPDDLRAMMPAGGVRRASAVLVLFGPAEGGGEDVLLTQRADTLRSHAGQVAFPGGSVDETDDGPVAAALREATEETGVDPAGVQVLGVLPERLLPPSNFVVTPVLSWWAVPSPVAPVDALEVAQVVRVRVAELIDPANRFRVLHPSGYVGPGFTVGGLFVWGFTAMLLSLVLDEAGLAVPWDTSRLEPLPAGSS